MGDCYHCGLPVPTCSVYYVEIDGVSRSMCCPGCQAVAQAIIAAGFGDYYRHRTEPARNPDELVPQFVSDSAAYDLPAVQDSFVHERSGGLREASLIIEGVNCAACSWLNERHLQNLAGVREAQVNYSTQRARVVWNPTQTRLSKILEAIQDIGYLAHPYDARRREQIADQARKQLLRRIGVSGALGMQVMMIAVAMYFGAWTGIDDTYLTLFRWVSLGLVSPVVVYAAQPFFTNALRDLKRFRVGMDVPVSLGILTAFLGSAWATWQGTGHVYFESVVMFTFFLLTARYLESVAYQHNVQQLDAISHAAPDTALRVDDSGETETVVARELKVGDRVRVPPGVTIPADGVVTDGVSSVSESLLTGESRPLRKQVGDALLAGSVNVEQPLELTVSCAHDRTVLSQIVRLVERAQLRKPHMTQLADRAARVFVIGVLLLAAAAGWYWWHQAPEQWLAVSISLLVVTCPCALSLATPTAITAATSALTRDGLITANSDAIQQLAHVTHVVFDKTGTLTEGRMTLMGMRRYTNKDRAQILSIAAALEASSQHPVARAVLQASRDDSSAKQAFDVSVQAGRGITGIVDDRRWYLGSPAFIRDTTGIKDIHHGDGSETLAVLADDHIVHAELLFADSVRADAAQTVAALRHKGIRVMLYSGDRNRAVADVADALAIDDYAAELTPSEKLNRLRQLQDQGHSVAVIGDGINDAPVLSAAQVSVAMGQGADLAQISADIILINEQLFTLIKTHDIATRTLRVVRQNIAWAIGYNLLAVPAAAIGMVPPWLAAIGMSMSSLLVVFNASRLARSRADVEPATLGVSAKGWAH